MFYNSGVVISDQFNHLILIQNLEYSGKNRQKQEFWGIFFFGAPPFVMCFFLEQDNSSVILSKPISKVSTLQAMIVLAGNVDKLAHCNLDSRIGRRQCCLWQRGVCQGTGVKSGFKTKLMVTSDPVKACTIQDYYQRVTSSKIDV